MKAKYIGCVRNGWEHTELEYEYRGHTYFVTKHNNGYMGESLAEQHKKAQRDIDKAIEQANSNTEWQYEGSAQEGFDIFWKMLGEKF